MTPHGLEGCVATTNPQLHPSQEQNLCSQTCSIRRVASQLNLVGVFFFCPEMEVEQRAQVRGWQSDFLKIQVFLLSFLCFVWVSLLFRILLSSFLPSSPQTCLNGFHYCIQISCQFGMDDQRCVVLIALSYAF